MPPSSLNPYSNGMRIEQISCSCVRIEPSVDGKAPQWTLSLNPYSNGMRIEQGTPQK